MRLTADWVTFSSVAARVELRKRAAASNTKSALAEGSSRRSDVMPWVRSCDGVGKPTCPGYTTAQAAELQESRWRKVAALRSEEHTSELQSLMRISYAVFCLTQKKN